MFYTNIFCRSNKIYMRGFDKGLRIQEKIDYEPYLFIPSEKDEEYKTLTGEPVKKVNFKDISSARTFIDQFKDVSNFRFFGLTNYEYVYLYDKFKGEINYDPKLIRVGNFDIECAADEGFPDISKADKEITAITIRFRKKNFVFGCGKFTTDDSNTNYFECIDEYHLLSQFIACWRALDLDIITGWNIEGFDIPYLINRMKVLYDKDVYKRLSPWGFVYEKKMIHHGKEILTYEIKGITTLDYLQLYRKFSFGNEESYRLDFIGELVVGEKKIDYTEYGSLIELYRKNYQKFIEYNIHDVKLVDKIDDKLKFIEQVMALAYDAKVNYIDTMTTVRPWDVIIHNYLMDKKIVIPQNKENVMNNLLMGGHVKEPIPGFYKWVVSFDLNSLYPHLIMQYNISPETFVKKFSSDEFPSMRELISGHGISKEYGYSFAANGCAYRKNVYGFLPEIMQKMYDDRVKYKKMMIDAKKNYEKTKSANDEMLIARYHNMQLAKKIQLNSAYGALGNVYFRWFNFDHAEAITSSGQLSVQWIERKMNEYMNNLLKTKNIDYVIASDTDSIYLTFEKMVDLSGEKDDLKIVKMIDIFCEKKIQPFLNSSYQELADSMNAFSQKMFMKRETIANKAIWRGKKMYILNAWNVEGVQFDEPKLKITGIEAVRSSTPGICRKNIKEALSIVMNKNESELQKFIKDFKKEFNNLPFEEVAFPRTVNGIDKYSDRNILYKSGTPIHVKGSLIFNSLLERHKIKTIAPLQNGDKIKFAYLTIPNPIQETVISAPHELPDIFNLNSYIDREMQFKKSFIDPINSVIDTIGWSIEKRRTLF